MMPVAEMSLDVLFFLATVLASAFPIAYLVLPWNGTPQGRAIMHFAISVALTMNLFLLFKFWYPENYWARWFPQFICLGYVAIAAGYRTSVLIRDIRTHWTPPPDKDIVGTDLSGHPEA